MKVWRAGASVSDDSYGLLVHSSEGTFGKGILVIQTQTTVSAMGESSYSATTNFYDADSKNISVNYMKIIKRHHYFITISVIVAIVWVFIPETGSNDEERCYHKLMGERLDFHLFNKILFYYFIFGNFILVSLRKVLSILVFVLLEILLLIPVVIKLYIFQCSQ